jgi:hypothetical protein
VPDIDATYQVFGYRVTQDVMIASGNLQWPYPKFHHTFLVAGGAEVTALAGKCQEVFVAAVFAFHTGKSVMQIAAIEVPVNDLLRMRSSESALPGEMIIIKCLGT